MFPLQVSDFYPGLQILAVPVKLSQGITEFDLPSGFSGICSGEFLLEKPLPMQIVKQETEKQFALAPCNGLEIRENAVLTGKILRKEDMGYLVEIGIGKTGFLPFTEIKLTQKSIQYLPVIVLKLGKLALLGYWEYNNENQVESTLLSPGTKIRGSIKSFNERVADVICPQAQHFAFQLPFQFFRRNKEVDPGFYEGFEDVFTILAVDYKYNKAILTCHQNLQMKNVSDFLVQRKFLTNQKVICNQGRPYMAFKPQLELLSIDAQQHLQQQHQCESLQQLQILIENQFDQVWTYLLPTEYYTFLREKEIDSKEENIIIPVVKPNKFYYFENVFQCDLINIDSVENIQNFDQEVDKLRELLPIKLGTQLDKVYEVIVQKIEKNYILAQSSYYFQGKKYQLRIRINKNQIELPSIKQNLAIKYKFQVVAITYDNFGYYNIIAVCPYKFSTNTIFGETMKVGDFGSGTVCQTMNMFPFTIVQLYGTDAQCFQKLTLGENYNFTVIYEKKGQRNCVYQTEEPLTQRQILDLYINDKSINQALVRSQLPSQGYFVGKQLDCKDIFLHGITAGCFILKDSSDSIRFMLPSSFLSEKQIEDFLLFEKNQEISQLLSKIYIVQLFGSDPLVSIYVAPISFQTDQPIQMKQIYSGFVGIKQESNFIVTLFNGEQVHIRNIDSDQQVGLFERIQVLIVKQASEGFYIGKVPLKLDFKEDLIEIYPKIEFKQLALAKTMSINNTTEMKNLLNTTVLADLLVFNKVLPFPQLIVDLGSGLIGRLNIRGLLHSIEDTSSFNINDSTDLEHHFKSIVKQHTQKQNNLFIFKSGEVIDFIESQLQHLTFTVEENKGISVLDLQLPGTSLNSSAFYVIYKDPQIAVCELIQSPRPSFIIFSIADQNTINNGVQLQLGQIYNLKNLDKSKFLKFNTELIISKLVQLNIPKDILLFEYEYFFYDVQSLIVDDNLVQQPYPHYNAITSAQRLNTYSAIEVEVPISAIKKDFNSYYDVSNKVIAQTDLFVPRDLYEIIPGIPLRGVVTGYDDQRMRATCCSIAPAKVTGNLQDKDEVVDFVVEGYENNSIIGTSKPLNMKLQSQLAPNQVLRAKMFTVLNGVILAQLIDVFPSTTCYIQATDIYMKNKLINVKLTQINPIITAEVDQKLKTQKSSKYSDSFTNFNLFNVQTANLTLSPPAYTQLIQFTKALERYNYDSGTWLAYADFFGQDVEEALKILTIALSTPELKNQEFLNVANCYLQVIFNEKNSEFPVIFNEILDKIEAKSSLIGQLAISLQCEEILKFAKTENVEFLMQKCYFALYQGAKLSTLEDDMCEIVQKSSEEQTWSFREQIGRIYYQIGEFSLGEHEFEKYSQECPVTFLLSYVRCEIESFGVKRARNLFTDLLARNYGSRSYKIKKILLQKYDEFEKTQKQ